MALGGARAARRARRSTASRRRAGSATCSTSSKGQAAFEELPPPDGLPGHAAALPGARLLLAGVPAPLGPRRLPGRRHGPGQDGPDARPAPARLGAHGAPRPTLLICPTSVVGNWQKEAARFTPGPAGAGPPRPERGRGARRSRRQADEARPGPLQLRAAAPRPRRCSRRSTWAGVILDEAQNIKNPATKQAQAARALTADYRIALTGTPVENHVGDLWSIMEFLNPGLLGTQAEFQRRFFVPIQAAAATPRPPSG